MKKISFFISTLAVNFFLAQTSIAVWNKQNFAPTVKNNLVSAENIFSTVGISADKDNQTFFNTSDWPTPNYNDLTEKTLDTNKYVQFTVKPKIGNQINLNSFNFDYRMQGGSAKLEIRYSVDPNFSNYKVLVEDLLIENKSWAKLSCSDFSGLPRQIIVSGKALYVRVYVYQTNNRFQIKYTQDSDGPTILGTAKAQQASVPIPENDTTTTTKNNDVNIKILDNDFFQTTTNVVIDTAPTHGAVSINTDNSITYTPEASFIGKDFFFYRLVDANGTSSLARVDVDVTAEKTISIIQWDNLSLSAHALIPGVIGKSVKGNILGISGDTWSEPIFKISGLSKPTEAIDLNKYIEFTFEPNGKQLDLKSFDIEYRANGGTGYFKMEYSKDPNFATGVKVLTSEIAYDDKWKASSFDFGAEAILKPGEKVFVRLYPYKSYNDLLIRLSAKPLSGPLVKAIVSNYNVTSWVNPAQPYWDNGTPNLLKNAVIVANYDTSLYGSIEASNITVNSETKVTVNNNDYIKLSNALTNLGTGDNIVFAPDANFLQTNNTPNIGKVTVKRTTKLPKKGYNYWSSPVTGQNLYQFSDGYNQASNPANPQGTPWNQFFIYNEKNDYFVTSIPNELKLDANSEFLKSRGYAIRGKNSFPTEINATSPEAEFKFVGVPNNGTIESYILKYTNEDHGYNLVGNPYPSNIDLDIFFIENADLIQPIAYFWTNNDMSISTQQGSQYNGNNYAIYNRMGGIPATYKGLNKNIPNISVKTSQGFIIKAKATGQNKALRFTNAMRTKEQGVFFNYKAAEKNRFWLNLKSEADINNEILIGYLEDASNAFDADLDTELLAVGEDAIWSNLDNKQLGIQARSWNGNQEDVVKLGVQLSAAGNYSISLGDVEGIFNQNQNIYLKDNSNSQIIDLSNGSYNFYGEKGIYNERFEIVYKKKETTLAVTETQKNVLVYKNNDAFVITSKTDNIEEVEVYDALGRLVYQTKPNNKATQISLNQFAKGMFILKISTKTNMLTKKIIN